ncbi:maker587 [Drosophila busckii]|uniref:CG3107 n=1 Tax=Drosophila busckii TaxID=30019 RepID=A0A0M3QU57_DROBS|nr:CG3107 [Drosophila busckii]ALC40083.1 maker585 [Drosophila busckii]ALC40133.1 maker587 [Drosophila busckii]
MIRRLSCYKTVVRPIPILTSQFVRRNSKLIVDNDEIAAEVTTPYILPDRSYKYKEGKVYNEFLCERVEYISDFELMSCTMRHLGTGTKLWYIDRNDTNNVFSINFRTPPFDSTGLPHILEHLALCGSKKFPVRDPFFKMLNRSVATNMNALTAVDFTVYPFSSRNEVDFRNIQQIYLDAVFSPNLYYLDFLQEGWRFEHSDINDPRSEIMLKGIVYNEMKGIFSENTRIFKRSMIKNLLPSYAYSYVAGGDPLEIPKATYAAHHQSPDGLSHVMPTLLVALITWVLLPTNRIKLLLDCSCAIRLMFRNALN